jgi:hypothetical protein
MPRKSKKEEHPNPAMVDSDILSHGGFQKQYSQFFPNNTKTRLQTSLSCFFLHFLRHQHGEADHHNMKFNPNVWKTKNNKEKKKYVKL